MNTVLMKSEHQVKYTSFDHSITIQAIKEKVQGKILIFFEVLLCFLWTFLGVWRDKND